MSKDDPKDDNKGASFSGSNQLQTDYLVILTQCSFIEIINFFSVEL